MAVTAQQDRLLAIVAEVVATNALKFSNEFTKLLPSLPTVAKYGIAFYFLNSALKSIPISITYAAWPSVGIVFVSLVAFLLFEQRLDKPSPH